MARLYISGGYSYIPLVRLSCVGEHVEISNVDSYGSGLLGGGAVGDGLRRGETVPAPKVR